MSFTRTGRAGRRKRRERPHASWADTRQKIRGRKRLKRVAVWTIFVSLFVALDAVMRSEPRAIPYALIVLFTALFFYGGIATYLYLEVFALNRRLVREVRGLPLSDDAETFATLVELLECRSSRVKSIALDNLYILLSASTLETRTSVPPSVCREFAGLLYSRPMMYLSFAPPNSGLARHQTLWILRLLAAHGDAEALQLLLSASYHINPADTELKESFRDTIAAIRQNQQRKTLPQSLVRSAEAPAASTLLRPGANSSQTPAAPLLRSVSAPNTAFAGTGVGEKEHKTSDRNQTKEPIR